jgi:serine/threonine protein phosphatase PrpC
MPENSYVTCPRCGNQNRAGASFCAQCGQPVDHYPLPVSQPQGGFLEKLVQGTVGVIKDLLPHKEEVVSGSPQAMPGADSLPISAVQPTVRLTNERSLPPLGLDELVDNRYVVTQAYPLAHSNYYDVYDLNCAECGRANSPAPGGICAQCGQPLARYLLREAAEARGDLSEPELVELSKENPFIIPHRQVRWLGDRAYVWLPPLPQWRSLAKVKVPAPIDQVIVWGQHIGSALAGLAGHAYYDPSLPGIEKIIIDGGIARLADLTSCRRASGLDVQRDTYFLARVLYYLLTGRNLAREGGAADVPPPLRPVIERAMRGDYRTMDEMLADLSGRLPKDAYGLSLKPVSGKASDVGRARDINEDSLLAFEMTGVQESRGVPIGFYLVADGMGGHQAGEIASRVVQRIITERVLNAQVLPGLKFATRRLDDTPGSVLASAIQEANRTLHTQARARGSDMGTTLTAALIIGDTATIANVGDSRTYLLRGGRLRQATTDHSLVASLLAAGVIGPEEVRQHPQRNQIYRTLGAKPEVEVDVFTETLQRGDRLILCSDGLWEMVLDADIARIVQEAANPLAACDALVRQANHAGGEDNITVIVVKLE